MKRPRSAASLLEPGGNGQSPLSKSMRDNLNIVKDHVHTIRPRRAPAYLTLSFAPGKCAQVDWGLCGSVPVGQSRRKLSMVLLHEAEFPSVLYQTLLEVYRSLLVRLPWGDSSSLRRESDFGL